MHIEIMMIVFLGVLFGLTLRACWTDWRHLQISNGMCLAVAAVFLLAFLLQPQSFGPWWSHLGAGALMLALTFGMFCFGLFGGGDAKLAAALSLWLGLPSLAPFVMFMGIAGGGLALLGIYIKRRRPFSRPAKESWIDQLQQGRNALPYGIAISAGFWAAVFHTPPLLARLHEVIDLIL